MNFKKQNDIESAGFVGFKPIKDMKNGGCKDLPDAPGVYMIIRKNSAEPHFLSVGSGGHFKDEDPNVPEDVLKINWVGNTCVMYIGKATRLKSRISQYMRFGKGKNVGHWGGRLIWQLSDADELLVAWKPVTEDPRIVEAALINEFKTAYSKLPFANLKD